MLMIHYLMLLLFSEYCRENYEPVGSDRDVMIPNLMLLLFSEYCERIMSLWVLIEMLMIRIGCYCCLRVLLTEL